MKIKDQLECLRDALDKYASDSDSGGYCKIAGDRSQLVNLLGLKPGSLRIVLCWMGETPRGETDPEEMSRVDRTFHAYLSRGQGFNLDPAASLVKGTAGGSAMFDLCEGARDVMRSVQLDPETTERPIYYKGMFPFADENLPRTDTMYVEIAIGTEIGGLE